ncbi:hypothetical protein N7509_000834 [Penicillium cosmopolitanum]|uniref:Uncharacterized protein n=1 Tax=Penicillium cosmopolitanum TaxID=1131564 RepID=A0A9W9WBI4_9EURO|nr:uncharacterized protein N7509_000834 [Penicillium cosmopolitanum]KAJ5414207.1 hypothetical protein N7509_000834 [Penicillium cosmopolitanum]
MYKGKGSAADGTLAPAEVADRFNFVSPRTAFVVWCSWGFDVDCCLIKITRSWANYNTIVDAQQTVIMLKIFLDIYKHPDERKIFKNLDTHGFDTLFLDRFIASFPGHFVSALADSFSVYNESVTIIFQRTNSNVRNVEAAFMQATGIVSPTAWTNCLEGKGMFNQCITLPTTSGTRECANCHLHHKAALCSFNKDTTATTQEDPNLAPRRSDKGIQRKFDGQGRAARETDSYARVTQSCSPRRDDDLLRAVRGNASNDTVRPR